MGDNRDNSTDSRVLKAMGYIPLDHIFGRVSMIFYSRGIGPGGGSVVRQERIGTIVR
jgi:signal peptidase I